MLQHEFNWILVCCVFVAALTFVTGARAFVTSPWVLHTALSTSISAGSTMRYAELPVEELLMPTGPRRKYVSGNLRMCVSACILVDTLHICRHEFFADLENSWRQLSPDKTKLQYTSIRLVLGAMQFDPKYQGTPYRLVWRFEMAMECHFKRFVF